MNDDRFIELVNLYIDRQISGEETAALEAEMQANPSRRAIYRQYCQMHRATTLVYESFRSDSVGSTTETRGQPGKIAHFEPQQTRRRTSWAYYATGLVAAGVALAFTLSNSGKQTGQNFAAVSLPAQPAAVAAPMPAAAIATPVVVASSTQINPVAIRANTLVVEQDYAAMLATIRKEEKRAFASGQIQPSRTSSLFEDGIFDAQPTGSSTLFRKKPAATQQTEFAAFQFQR